MLTAAGCLSLDGMFSTTELKLGCIVEFSAAGDFRSISDIQYIPGQYTVQCVLESLHAGNLHARCCEKLSLSRSSFDPLLTQALGFPRFFLLPSCSTIPRT